MQSLGVQEHHNVEEIVSIKKANIKYMEAGESSWSDKSSNLT